MKFALVKQDVYQDLYVCSSKADGIEALESTLMRIGPLSLIEDYHADFFIIKENKNKECQAYMRSLYVSKELKQQLKTLPASKISLGTFAYLKPQTNNSHADFSVDADQINWSDYDCVISINVSIPTSIVKKYPNTLWCYMYGEANADNRFPRFGYDVILTQNLTGEVASSLGKIDFPYSFLGCKTLENIAKKKFGKISLKDKTGVYAEINNTIERPVTKVDCLSFVRKLGHDVILHDQNIMTNLQRLYKAKYFVKLEGRKIRGNSVIEAISAGTLVIMNPKDLLHSQLIPKELWIHNKDELKQLIIKLDSSPALYKKELEKERELLQFFVVDTPIESLENALIAKRKGLKVSIPSFKETVKYVLKILGIR